MGLVIGCDAFFEEAGCVMEQSSPNTIVETCCALPSSVVFSGQLRACVDKNAPFGVAILYNAVL